MAALTLFIFSLLVSTTFAIEDLEKPQVVEKEERPAFQALPLRLAADKKEFYFHVYFHEIFDGVKKTTETVISPNNDFPEFGQIGIMDVPLWSDLNEKTLIARMQGAALQSDQNTYGWHLSCSIEFELPALKGSTLQIMGRALQLTSPREFAIVGGTGVFTLAQGVIYGRRLSSPDDSLWIELKINGYYTPMTQPPWK
ncbi:dirigent protein 22-like protein [Carex littledalei]|uniref:Dirigent protein n=1 Tax=Carex littledalei TaxID=544730 RepID=A0A833V7E1_9POAL|nr:dirigent protein 22-like protein [Carex littledalei]